MSSAAALICVSNALACSIAFTENPSESRIQYGNCAAAIHYDEAAGANISEVNDLGNGFVWQELSDGFACSPPERNMVIQDCNSGRAAVFGETISDDANDITAYRFGELSVQIRSKFAAGRPMTIDQILAEATKARIEFRLETSTRSTLAINGHKFPLGCGCRTLYPDLAGTHG